MSQSATFDHRVLARTEAPDFTPVRGIRVLRLINKLLPLRHRLFPLVRKYAKVDGLLSVAWGKYQLLFPSEWHRSFTMTSLIFQGREIIPEATLLSSLFSKMNDGTLVDVGAHIGCYVLEFRNYSSQPIVAFEPSPTVFKILKANVLLNSLSNVQLRNAACGDTVGAITMNVGINSSIRPELEVGARPQTAVTAITQSQNLETPAQAEVEVTTLDNELESLSGVSLIKIDCEGFEYQVLAGAINVIRKYRPILFIELHPQLISQYGFGPLDVCDLLRPYYDLEFHTFGASESSRSYIRFAGRYRRNQGYKFNSEEEMLKVVTGSSPPAQVYILARS